MSSIENYPKKDGNRDIYVRYPVQVTEEYNEISPLQIEEGKWVAVNVLEEGYQPLLSPNPFETFEQCEKACRISNKFWGFTDDEVIAIVDASMNNSLKEN